MLLRGLTMSRNKRVRHVSPTSWAETIAARQPMARAVADDVMAKLYSAFGDLKAGSTDDDLFDRLAAAINVGIVRAEQIDQACVAPMLGARDAQIDFCMGKESSFEVAFARRIEAAHGIGIPATGGEGAK